MSSQPMLHVPLFAGPGGSSKLSLRDYQREAMDAAIRNLEAGSSTLIVMATGTGKTETALGVADHFMQTTGKRILWLAERDLLVMDAARRFHDALGVEPEVEMSSYWADTSRFTKARVIVSSVQTQRSGQQGNGRMSRFNPSDFGLIVYDEAHHAVSPQGKKVINYYRENNPSIKLLGLTATPKRHDQKALGKIFDSVSYHYDTHDAVSDGWLVNVTAKPLLVRSLNLDEAKVVAGDLTQSSLGDLLMYERPMHEMCWPIYDQTRGMLTVIFVPTRAVADRAAEIINRWSWKETGEECARCIDQKTPREDRFRMMDDFKARRFTHLVNVMVCTEGWDQPSVECIAMCRPTKSNGLFRQMLGRGLRPLPGVVDGFETPEERKKAIAESDKTKLLVLDLVGTTEKHTLVKLTDVLGGRYDEDVQEQAARQIKEHEEQGEEYDVDEELEKAQRKIDEDREEQRQAMLRSREIEASKRRSIVMKTEYHVGDQKDPFDIFGIHQRRTMKNPLQGADKPISEKMRAILERERVPDIDNLSYADAKQLCNEAVQGYAGWKPTLKQRRQLKKYGFPVEMTKKQAMVIMDAIAKNDWKPLKDHEMYTAAEAAGIKRNNWRPWHGMFQKSKRRR